MSSSKHQDYESFVEKFKPRLTTDDCYTPPAVYETVLSWARRYASIPSDAPILRPFRPGGDYEGEAYPSGSYVVDNPPFSILSKIVRFYMERGVGFFLFAPALTALGFTRFPGVTVIFQNAPIVYENGACVRTAFLTNLTPEWRAVTAPDLDASLRRLQRRSSSLPRYDYPDEVLRSTDLCHLAGAGIPFRLHAEECRYIVALDAQRPLKKGIFGGGLLLSPSATSRRRLAFAKYSSELSERAARRSIVFSLSDRERLLFSDPLSPDSL